MAHFRAERFSITLWQEAGGAYTWEVRRQIFGGNRRRPESFPGPLYGEGSELGTTPLESRALAMRIGLAALLDVSKTTLPNTHERRS